MAGASRPTDRGKEYVPAIFHPRHIEVEVEWRNQSLHAWSALGKARMKQEISPKFLAAVCILLLLYQCIVFV